MEDEVAEAVRRGLSTILSDHERMLKRSSSEKIRSSGIPQEMVVKYIEELVPPSTKRSVYLHAVKTALDDGEATGRFTRVEKDGKILIRTQKSKNYPTNVRQPLNRSTKQGNLVAENIHSFPGSCPAGKVPHHSITTSMDHFHMKLQRFIIDVL